MFVSKIPSNLELHGGRLVHASCLHALSLQAVLQPRVPGALSDGPAVRLPAPVRRSVYQLRLQQGAVGRDAALAGLPVCPRGAVLRCGCSTPSVGIRAVLDEAVGDERQREHHNASRVSEVPDRAAESDKRRQHGVRVLSVQESVCGSEVMTRPVHEEYRGELPGYEGQARGCEEGEQ